MKFELLREEDVKGEKCLSIFKKLSPAAVATDVVNNQFPSVAQKRNRYWLNSYRLYYTERRAWEFGSDSNIEAKCVDGRGEIFSSELSSKQIGVRLKVSYDDIKDEIIRETEDDTPYVVEVENGVKVLLALQWPQEFVTEKQDKYNLDILHKYGKLEETKKKFHISTDKIVSTVYYKQNMYVKISNNWAKVAPIEWYYDEEANVLVSKKIIFSCPMSDCSGKYMEQFDYEKSIIASFICEKFEKEAIMDFLERELYFFPLSLYDYDYADELKEILFWKTYHEKRRERKISVENIKNMLSTESGDELSQIIDDILKLNEEDEKLVKQFVVPKYIVNRSDY